MNPYELQLVNPKNGNEKTITIFADRAAAERAPDPDAYVQAVARPHMPAGFMGIMGRVRPVVLS